MLLSEPSFYLVILYQFVAKISGRYLSVIVQNAVNEKNLHYYKMYWNEKEI